MAFRFKRPLPSDYDDWDEYEAMVAAYEDAEDDYADACMERYYEEK